MPITAPTLNSPTHTSITTSSAILGANITSSGGASITARGTCWGLTSTTATTCMAEGGIALGVFSHLRTGLPAGTIIYYRGYATNSAGLTGYSSPVTSFSTLAGATVPTLTTLIPASITSSSALLGFSFSNTGGAPITAKGLCWGTTNNPTTNCNDYGPGSGAPGEWGGVITGMPSGTLIYFRAYGTNSAGTGYSFPSMSFTTLNAPTIDLTAGSVAPITATVDAPINLSAVISNIGSGSTNASFPNFFQITKVSQWTTRESSRNWRTIAISSTGQYQSALVYGGQIYTSSDYGVSWTARDSNRSWYTIAMSSTGQYQTAAVANGGQIYTTSNYGVSWTARASGSNWFSIAISSTGQYQTAVAYGGQIYTSSNYGVSWMARESNRLWFGITMSSTGQYQTAVVNGGQIYTSSNYGVSWTARDSNRNWDGTGIAMSSDGRYQTAAVFTNGGQIYTSSNYGVTWVARASFGRWHSIDMSADGKHQVAINNFAFIYTSSDYGVSWTARDSNRNWRTIAISSTGQYQTAAVNGGQIYTSSNYGATWTARDSNRSWYTIAMSSTGQYQTAAVQGGQIYTSSDYGGENIIDLLPATTMPTLTAGGSASALKTYTFTSPGVYLARACADKIDRNDTIGFINETNENNNCGEWTNVVVSLPPIYSCTGVTPINASIYLDDDAGLTTDTAKTHSVINTATKCEYSCNSGYLWSGSSCVVPPAFSCMGVTPPSATIYVGDDAGLVANTPKTYSTTNTVTKCQFSCNTGFSWNGTSCVASSCGDTVCNGTETLLTCPRDCKTKVIQF